MTGKGNIRCSMQKLNTPFFSIWRDLSNDTKFVLRTLIFRKIVDCLYHPTANMVMNGPSTGDGSRLNSYLLSNCATPRLGLLSGESEHGQHLRQCASALSTSTGSALSPCGPGSLAPFGPLSLPYMPYLGALTQMDLQMYAALAASTAATPLTPFRPSMAVSAHTPLFASMTPLAAANNEATFEMATSKRSGQERQFLPSPKTD